MAQFTDNLLTQVEGGPFTIIVNEPPDYSSGYSSLPRAPNTILIVNGPGGGGGGPVTMGDKILRPEANSHNMILIGFLMKVHQ